jgi:xanthine dehydrogenase accessory factor
MTLRAADVAELLLATAEAGGSAAAAVVVGGSAEGLAGRRLAIVIPTPGAAHTTHGGLGSAALDAAAGELLLDTLADPRAQDGLRELAVQAQQVELYVEVRRPVHELIVVGAGHVAQPIAHVGALLGFRVVVIDDRPDIATRERFPDADRMIRADISDTFADVSLNGRSHILLVTRGHKYDYECLIRALRTDPPPAYIGMIGSRRRVRATYVQLVDEGIDRALIDRIHAPVGLDIGSETPEEIAVSVAAELVMLRRGGTGVPLKDVERVAERFFHQTGGE